jgi:RND family efflux transporter MFP subunit
MSHESVPTSPVSRKGLRLAGLVGLVVVIGVVVIGVVSRASEAKNLGDWTDKQAVPTVTVAAPGQGNGSKPLELPGRLEAYSRASIYARVPGYLKSWKVDIGARVKAGQLLAEIETPDLDQQLLQARADLASAKANADLAAITTKRWKAMLEADSVSAQESDEKSGDYTAKQAMVNAAQANLDRIVAMKGFTRILAPFDGVVTARNTDVGALINAGSSSGTELFAVSDVHQLRVYVRVPQNYVPAIKTGATATLIVPEYPDKTFTARIDSSAEAVAADSGTTLVQLSVDNADGKLMPGSFASVRFDVSGAAQALSVPASALIFDERGMRVAVLDKDNRVAFKTVTIGRDLGKVVELGSGLEAGDRVIQSPPDGLGAGDHVQIATDTASAKTHAKA